LAQRATGRWRIHLIEVATKTEDGELKIKDPETGKWETVE
jgi:hypothetical protein